MKNEICELVFVLDRSGSMYGLESDTAGGFNRVLEEQKNGKGKVFVTTVRLIEPVVTALATRYYDDQQLVLTCRILGIRG